MGAYGDWSDSRDDAWWRGSDSHQPDLESPGYCVCDELMSEHARCTECESPARGHCSEAADDYAHDCKQCWSHCKIRAYVNARPGVSGLLRGYRHVSAPPPVAVYDDGLQELYDAALARGEQGAWLRAAIEQKRAARAAMSEWN